MNSKLHILTLHYLNWHPISTHLSFSPSLSLKQKLLQFFHPQPIRISMFLNVTMLALAVKKKMGTETAQKILIYGMATSLFLLFCLCFWLYWVRHGSPVATHSTSGVGTIIEGKVFINGTTSIGRIDDDFVCATLDWWPPQKCDYRTCSWGRTSLLNLVSWSSLTCFSFFFNSPLILLFKSDMFLPFSLLS